MNLYKRRSSNNDTAIKTRVQKTSAYYKEVVLFLLEFQVTRWEKILEASRDEVTGEWRRLHKEELYNLLFTKYYSCDQTKIMRWVGHVAHKGERKGAYRVLVGKSEGKRPLGTHRRNWEGILKWISLKEGSMISGGPCHHGKARPQVADGGTYSMEQNPF